MPVGGYEYIRKRFPSLPGDALGGRGRSVAPVKDRRAELEEWIRLLSAPPVTSPVEELPPQEPTAWWKRPIPSNVTWALAALSGALAPPDSWQQRLAPALQQAVASKQFEEYMNFLNQQMVAPTRKPAPTLLGLSPQERERAELMASKRREAALTPWKQRLETARTAADVMRATEGKGFAVRDAGTELLVFSVGTGEVVSRVQKTPGKELVSMHTVEDEQGTQFLYGLKIDQFGNIEWEPASLPEDLKLVEKAGSIKDATRKGNENITAALFSALAITNVHKRAKVEGLDTMTVSRIIDEMTGDDEFGRPRYNLANVLANLTSEQRAQAIAMLNDLEMAARSGELTGPILNKYNEMISPAGRTRQFVGSVIGSLLGITPRAAEAPAPAAKGCQFLKS